MEDGALGQRGRSFRGGNKGPRVHQTAGPMQLVGQGSVIGGALLQLQETGVVLTLLQDAMISGF